jgi:hypothetical protein
MESIAHIFKITRTKNLALLSLATPGHTTALICTDSFQDKYNREKNYNKIFNNNLN